MLHCSLYMKSNLVTCSLSQFSLNTSYILYIHQVCRKAGQHSWLFTFLGYINNLSSYIHHSKFLKFADDTECFLHINTLTTVPSRKMSLLYLPGPRILTWTSTSRYLFACHSNVSWTPHILRLTHVYHTLILIKILDSSCDSRINTTKPLMHVITKCQR